MSATCPYALLGVRDDASGEDIKRAYLEALAAIRARLGHDAPPVEHLDAVRGAYRLLADPDRRQRHDTARRAAVSARTVETAAGDATLTHPLAFTGDGKVYFRIWITNLLLSFLTLGVYSAWAKVRREQYFHRHLRLDNSAFDYHGKPLAILKGRLLLVCVLLIFYLARLAPPPIHAATLLLGAFAVPWLIVRSLRFRAANTSYRGLRFAFRGSYREALATYLGYGLLTVLSLGLALPLWLWRQKKFMLDNLGYGSNSFAFSATKAQFYRALWLPTALAFLVAGLVIGPLIWAIAIFGKSFIALMTVLLVARILVPFLVAAIFLAQFVVVPYARMLSLNLAWSNCRIDDVRFSCSQRFPGYGATQLANWLLTLLSCGLYWPWARVRLFRYRARHFAVHAADSLDAFRAGRSREVSASGHEIANSLDFDVGL